MFLVSKGNFFFTFILLTKVMSILGFVPMSQNIKVLAVACEKSESLKRLC